MHKISLIVGHSDKDPGAHAVEPINSEEHDFNENLAATLSTVLMKEFEVRVFSRIGASKLAFYEAIQAWEPDVSIELHFNASDKPEAFGTETLCAVNSRIFAQVIQESMCRALERDNKGGDRGVKILKPADRGHFNVNQLHCPNVLIEPFFGSNGADCALMLSKLEDFCKALDVGIGHYLSLS